MTETAQEAVEDVAQGDRLLMTSEPAGPGREPMVPAYRRGTRLRKVIG
ncbi:hypothetical protein FHR72_000328 [Mycolicibacterium iranicum]|uniref:Uncharacterized protein n=1 Tax=Mycolicibacterium iranicum TaxID=912594 RepID=A0A839Q8E3_MYCIR|nr:hypothetical protein [Mycolicibacterium iranicum]MBB2988871.1 hypothetical protein [Mycolicibacterium iranicum]